MSLLLMSFFEKPEWCLKLGEELNNPVYCDNTAEQYPNSNIPKMPRYASLVLNLIIVLILMGYTLLKM